MFNGCVPKSPTKRANQTPYQMVSAFESSTVSDIKMFTVEGEPSEYHNELSAAMWAAGAAGSSKSAKAKALEKELRAPCHFHMTHGSCKVCRALSEGQGQDCESEGFAWACSFIVAPVHGLETVSRTNRRCCGNPSIRC